MSYVFIPINWQQKRYTHSWTWFPINIFNRIYRINTRWYTIKVLRDGLRRVVSEGTGKRLDVPTIAPASGKSGTAEAGVGRPNHTWFGAYAPTNKPEIVVVAFGENSGDHGGTVCGPMVLQVLEAYFQHKYPGKYQKPQPDPSEAKTHSGHGTGD